MFWRNASIAPQRLAPRGEAAISVDLQGFDGLAASQINGFGRDMGRCRS